MAKQSRKQWYVSGILVFTVYVFAAARPIPEETVLRPRWISSFESDYPIILDGAQADESPDAGGGEPLPFSLGERFGYLEDSGRFALNRVRGGYVSMSETLWAGYGNTPSAIQVMNPRGGPVLDIENTGGYPLFLDGRMYIAGNAQNSIAAAGPRGEILWSYDFPAPLTCIGGAAGFVLAGTLDGAVILLDPSGKQAYSFEPGGSRFPVILGCAISRDAARIAVISGIDNQRFLLLEQSGDTYKVTHHEFLGAGFRRPVHTGFVDNGSRIAFEREGGLGIFDIRSRTSTVLDLEGEVCALDGSGTGGFLFAVTSRGEEEKRFTVIRYPGTAVAEAPFRSRSAFFARRGGKLYLGGDAAMVSFELERK